MPVEIKVETQIEVSDEQAQLLLSLRGLIEAGQASLGKINAVGEYQAAVAFLIGQAVASGKALHLLCPAGHANQARPIVRSMLENVINAYYIAREPETRAKRFWVYRPIPHAEVAEARFRVFGITEELEEIRAQAAEAKKLLSNQHWAGRTSVRSRAMQCGLLALWELYYSEASAFSHGDASTWNAFVAADGSAVKLGPSSEGIEAVIAPAISALFGGLALLCHVFTNRDLNRDLERLAGMLPELTKRLDLRSQFDVLRSKS